MNSKIRSIIWGNHLYLLYFFLLCYFSIFYLAQVIYVQWSPSALPYIFCFNLFWAGHMILIHIPVAIFFKIKKIEIRKRLRINSFIACFFVIVLTFPNFLFYELYQGPPSITVTSQAFDFAFLKTIAPFFLDLRNIVFYFLFPIFITLVFNFFSTKVSRGNSQVLINLIIIISFSILGKEVVQRGLKNESYIPEHNPYNPLYYMYVANRIPFKKKKHSFGHLAKANIEKSDLYFAETFLKENYPSNPHFTRRFSSQEFFRTRIAQKLQLPKGIKPNFVFLIMESLSTFHMRKDSMPFLTNFEKFYPNSLIFKNVLAVSDQTVKGQHAIFCGQYPTALGKISTDYTDLHVRCLSHLLKKHWGYRADAINGVGSSFHNKHHYFRHILGFDSMMGVESLPKDFFVKAAWGTSDLSSLKFSLDVLKRNKGPYLFQFMSVNFHGPYLLPKDSRDLSLNSKILATLPLSHQILHYDDASLKYFFEKAQKELASFNNTIFIITADTGGGQSRQKEHTSYELFEIRNKIPLIIYSPLFKKLKSPLIIEDVITQYNIAPLLLDIMGVKVDHSFIGIPPKFYDKKVTEDNSYVQLRFPNISQVFNMQYSYEKDNDVMVVNGMGKSFTDLEHMEKKMFISSPVPEKKKRLEQEFLMANDLWLKVYMPMLHFDRLL